MFFFMLFIVSGTLQTETWETATLHIAELLVMLTFSFVSAKSFVASLQLLCGCLLVHRVCEYGTVHAQNKGCMDRSGGQNDCKTGANGDMMKQVNSWSVIYSFQCAEWVGQ